MRKLKLFFTVLFLAVLGLGNVWAESATMTAGTNGSSAKVGDVDAIKVGTSKLGGSMTITVGAGATKLEFYAAAWKGVSDLSLNITPAANVDGSASVALTADAGIANNSPFTLAGSAEAYKHTISLKGITAETTLTFTSSAAKRFVVWGATYETSAPDQPTLSSIAVSGNPTKTTYWEGDAFEPAGLTVTGTYSDNSTKTIESGITWSKPAALTVGQTSVSVTATVGGKTSAAYTVNGLTVNAIPEKTIAEFIDAEGGKCYLIGTVSNIQSTTYGNFDLTDESGTIYVYGTLNSAKEEKKFAELGVEAGDRIKVIADEYKLFNGTKNEAVNVIFVEELEPIAGEPVLSVTPAGTKDFGTVDFAATIDAVEYTVEGTNLNAEMGITLTLSENAPFTLSVTELPAAGGTFTLTPVTTTAGTYTATLTVEALDANDEDNVVSQSITLKMVVSEPPYTCPADAITHDFTAISDFADWSSSYAEHNISYTESDVKFERANKNGQTITDQPVTKGQPITIVAKDGRTMSAVHFEFTQWTTKAQTINLFTSADGGETYGETALSTASDFQITAATLPEGTNAIKITFSSSSNQIGIKSACIVYSAPEVNYSITSTLSGCVADASNAIKYVENPTADITLKYALVEGYLWNNASVAVSVAGEALSAEEVDYLWDDTKTPAELTIAKEKLNGDIVVTISATPKAIAGIAVKTAPTKVDYYVGDNFDPAGLVITATYNDASTADVAYADAAADFSFAPALDAALALTDENVVITYNGKTCNQTISVTKAPLQADWIANAQGYADATAVVGSAIKHETTTIATVTFDKADGSYDPKYYANGEAARAYYGNTIEVSALKGFTIKKIVLTFGASDGSNVITTNAGEYADGTWTGEATKVTFTIGKNSSNETRGNRRIAGISVYYEGELATPTSIVLNTETVKKEFAFGEEFNSDNLKVEAVYADETTEDVTLAATVVAPDMTTAGEKTVTVNYLTFSANYTITVAAPTPVLTVDKTALAFGTVNLNATVEAKTVAVTLENLATATVALTGSDKFAADVATLTESGDVTISVTTDEAGEFTATLTISGEGVETKEVALSMKVVDVATISKENVTPTEIYASATSDVDLTTDAFVGSALTITYSAGTNNNNKPGFFVSDKTIRTYKDNTITIASTTKDIYMVEIVYKSKTYADQGMGVFANNNHGYYVPETASNTVELTATATSRITDIIVYYTDQKAEVRAGLVDGKFGTICVEKMTLAPKGATFYTLNQYNEAEQILTVSENTTGRLEAGVPYIYLAEGANISGIVVANAEDGKENENGFYAVLGANKVITAEEAAAASIYGIVNNTVRPAGEGASIKAGRCYIKIDEVSATGSDAAPARAFRVIRGTGTATGLEGLELIEGAQKLLHNGHVVILRDGKTYNVAGKIVK